MRDVAAMNAVDLVVPIGLSSTLATILLFQAKATATRLVARAVLIGLPYPIARLSSRSASIGKLFRAEPAFRLHRGRVACAEALTAVQAQGHAAGAAGEAVVFDPDSSFAVVMPASDTAGHSAPATVAAYAGAGRGSRPWPTSAQRGRVIAAAPSPRRLACLTGHPVGLGRGAVAGRVDDGR